MTDALDRLQAALADRYRVERELGAGGMAIVYLARDLRHDREVALKVLRPDLAQVLGPERFLREIRTTAQLTHPHILPLLDSGDADGTLFYVMPFVEGETLRGRLAREKQLPLDEALQIAREVADGLSYAHARGVIHRDIKPENILLESGHAVVADFGIARAITAAGGERLTQTGVALGTPAYMSPEQAAGSKDLDGRSDLYALACVLYEMLAGEPPFTGATAESVVRQHLAAEPAIVTSVRPAVPAGVARALQRALAKTPADRFASGQQLIEALFSGNVPTAAARMPAPARRRRRALAVTAVGGVAVVLAVIGLVRMRRGEPGRLNADVIAVLPFRVTSASPVLRELAQQIPDLLWAKVTGEFGPRTADPATVGKWWRAAGGSLERPVTEVQAIRIAETAGAGRLLVGSLTGTEAHIGLTASLAEVPSGRMLVAPTTVEGPYDSFPALTDRLVNQLLARDYGEAVQRLPELAAHPPAAVQAYLNGKRAWKQEGYVDFVTVRQLLNRALELDSTFALAALEKYRAGEVDGTAAAYAWAHQNELSPRDRALLRALTGWRFGAGHSEAEKIAQLDSMAQQAPEWDVPVGELAWTLHFMSPVVGMGNWRERNRIAEERALALDPQNFMMVFHLFEAALSGGEAQEVRRWAAELTRQMSDTSRRMDASSEAYAWTARLRQALSVGDTSAAARLWPEGEVLVASHRAQATTVLEPVLGGLLVDARGLRELDRFVAMVRSVNPFLGHYGVSWAWARGRYRDWESVREAFYGRLRPVAAAVYRVRNALFLGMPEDSSVRGSAAFLDRVARGAVAVPPSSSDPTPDVVWPNRARCWSTLWRVAHGQTEGARETVSYFRQKAPLPDRWSVCAGLIEVLLAERQRGDLRGAVMRLDSIVRPAPMESWPWLGGGRDMTHWVDNLVLSRLLLQVGDTARALAAARRGRPWETWFAVMSPGLLVDFLREEGRLAGMTGDTSGAVWAYDHYLSLRDAPDYGPWRAQRDSVRAELTALTRR